MAKNNMADEAYEIIQKKISNFDLYPDQIVSDHLLSKDLNMSRTPIRQALGRLEAEGLLEKADSGSTTYRITPITVEEIKDLFDFREGIETTAFRLAWNNGIKEDQLQSLQLVVDSMVKTNQEGQVKEHFFCDQQFHNRLVAISQNKRLIKAHNELQLQLTRMRFLSFLDQSLQQKACSDHTDILTAIRNGDYDGGYAAVANHIRSSCEDYIALINNGIPNNFIHMLRLFVTTGNDGKI